MAARVPGGRPTKPEAARARSRGTGAAPAPGEDRRHDDAPRAGRAPARKKGVRGGRAEVAEMSRRRSPIVGKRYPLRTVCDVWRVPRSSVYALTAASATAPPTAKRGPKTTQSDLEVVALIRAILAMSPFHSEGHRNVRVRLRQHGVHVGKARVLRLMRVHGLLAPTRPGPCAWRSRPRRAHHDRPARRARGLEGDQARRWVGAARAALPGRAVCLRPARQGRGARPHRADRLGPTVHGPRLRGAAALARHPALPVVRRRAPVQRGDRALHADAEGAVSVTAPLRRSRPGGTRDRGVHRALQRGVARGASRPLHAAGDPREATGGSVSRTGNCPGNPDRYRFVGPRLTTNKRGILLASHQAHWSPFLATRC